MHDIIDFIRIIREQPEWADAARSVLLSRELLELPQRFAEYAAATNQRLERLETTLADFMAATNQRLAALESGQDELKAIVTMHGAKLDQHGAKLDQLEAGQNEIRRSIGPLRGFLALNGGLRATRRIARIMNCRQVRLLNDDELHDMLRANDTTDIPFSEQVSFENADIVIMAEHRDTGDTHYIAVETSFTAHADDTRRAIRNAGYLSRFTGQPAHAVVVSVFASPEVRQIFASGQAHWYEIERRYLAPD